MNNEKESFLKRKNVITSFKRYGIDAMGSMALGLFASLLIGTIINTIGQNICPGSFVSEKLLEIGGYATSVTGAAMALAIGYALQAPPLVMYSLCAVGAACNAIGGSGGPLAVFFCRSAHLRDRQTGFQRDENRYYCNSGSNGYCRCSTGDAACTGVQKYL